MIFTFAYPWLLCWLAVPILVHWLTPPHREPRRGLVIPFLDRLAAQAGQTPTEGAAIMKGEVLDDFLSRRKGDRIGLIFFGTAPFVQAPFTEDIHVCRQLLDEAQVSMAGPQTAFGAAIGLAITLFGRSSTKEKVLIALTDGNDTSSKVPPAKAAEIAADKGIKVYTVAVGDPQAAGEDALDIGTLKHVAETTGGLYSFAADRRQLDEIYHHLDQIEVHQAQTISHRPRRDIFYWPLGIALLASFVQHGLQFLLARPRTAKTSSGAPPLRTQKVAT